MLRGGSQKGTKMCQKIMINNTITLFFKTAIRILLLSIHNSLTLEMASPGNRHCANCVGTLSLPTVVLRPFTQLLTYYAVDVGGGAGASVM